MAGAQKSDTARVSAQGSGATRPEHLTMFASLRYREFRLLWIGQTGHALALWMQMIALPLLVLHITDNNAAHLGGVMAARTLPTLLFGVFAGVIADWFDRRLILLGAKWSSFLLAVIFAALLVSGQLELWHIYVWGFVRGIGQAFEQPARYSMLPSILPGRLVTNAMALLSSTQNVMRIVGAAGAGVLVEIVGLEGTFSLIAIIYIGGLVATHMLRVPTHERPPGSGLGVMMAGLVEGARFAAGHTAVRGVLIVSLVYFTFGMSYMQVFAPLFAVEVLDIGSGGLGAMMALNGVGAVATALLIARQQPSRLGLILLLDVVVFGVALIAFSASTYLPGTAGIALPMALMLIIGGLQTTFMALSRSLMVQVAPDAMRGRVLALISLDRAMMAAGGAAGGVMAAAQGVQFTQLVFGGVCVAAGLAILAAAPGMRGFTTSRGRPEAPASPPLRGGGRPTVTSAGRRAGS